MFVIPNQTSFLKLMSRTILKQRLQIKLRTPMSAFFYKKSIWKMIKYGKIIKPSDYRSSMILGEEDFFSIKGFSDKKGIFFSKEDNDFIDIIRHNSLQLTKIKRSLALAAIIKACQKKQPRGLFTFKGFRYDDGRLDLKKSIQEQFFDAVKVFNKSIFNNKQNNIVLNKNFLDVNNRADLIYIDPPYYSKHSDNGYVRRYHFLEGIIRSWKGVEIQEKSIVKKFKNYPSMFDTEVGSKFAIELLIKKYANKIIIFSYSSNSLPDIDFFKKIGKKNNMKTSVKKINYTYSFGTQKTNSSMKNKVEEFIITMIQNG